MALQEQRKEVTVNLPSGGRTEAITAAVDRLAAGLARHWLAVFSLVLAVFVGLPFLAPWLMHLEAVGNCTACGSVGRLIYLVYRPTCHQLPERSFFLFGPQGVYSLTELERLGAVPSGLNILQREALRWTGAPTLGYKVAICERDVAIFGSMLLAGLFFGLARRHSRRSGRPIPKLPLRLYVLLLVPLVIDGTTQLIGLRESNWILRLITGILFGMATIWLAYPYVEEAMEDVARSSAAKDGGSAQRAS